MARWALVTGAASGIGRATARRLVGAGWQVAAFDLHDQGMQDLGAALTGALDVRDPAAWSAAIDAVSRASGGALHLLVNNAGVGAGGWLEDVPAERLRAVLDTNLLGPMLGVQAALPLLKQTPGARVVFVGSMTGACGPPQVAAYAASKAGVRALAESLSAELSRFDVAVTHLMPGLVDTPLLDGGSFSGDAVDLRRGALLSPDAVAAEVLRERGPLHRPLGRDARGVVWLARWWPGLLRWGMRREVG
ncbi:MAG: SDR family NAD(P)-dependent oxidoreductase [Alphaproteobacteria bacterium]|nr:SDR family NAD(P)-dependent oxidoreductase [Alphaproteobacteria bacterium]